MALIAGALQSFRRLAFLSLRIGVGQLNKR